MKILKTCTLITVILLNPAYIEATEPDWDIYDTLLKRYVTFDTRFGIVLTQVNYPSLATDPLFRDLITQISSYPVQQLTTREERLAFYINTYNILAIKMVGDHWPIRSIKDAGSLFSPVWENPAGIIAGRTVTLDEIEHKILRPMGDPRIHMAIVCASVSCPDLRLEPYTAKELNTQLDDQIRQFLNNPGKGLRIENGVINISKIFDWFEKDFSEYGSISGFIRHYRRALPEDLPIETNIEYNWLLNYTGNVS